MRCTIAEVQQLSAFAVRWSFFDPTGFHRSRLEKLAFRFQDGYIVESVGGCPGNLPSSVSARCVRQDRRPMIGGRVAWRGAGEFRVPVGGVASVVWQLRYGSACDMNSVWPVVLATFAIFCSSRRTVQSRNITQTARLHGADIGSARPEGAATYQPRAEWTRPGEGTPPWVGMASPAKAL